MLEIVACAKNTCLLTQAIQMRRVHLVVALAIGFLGLVFLRRISFGLEFLGPETERLVAMLIFWCHPKAAVPNAPHLYTPLPSGDLIISKRTFDGSHVTPSALRLWQLTHKRLDMSIRATGVGGGRPGLIDLGWGRGAVGVVNKGLKLRFRRPKLGGFGSTVLKVLLMLGGRIAFGCIVGTNLRLRHRLD